MASGPLRLGLQAMCNHLGPLGPDPVRLDTPWAQACAHFSFGSSFPNYQALLQISSIALTSYALLNMSGEMSGLAQNIRHCPEVTGLAWQWQGRPWAREPDLGPMLWGSLLVWPIALAPHHTGEIGSTTQMSAPSRPGPRLASLFLRPSQPGPRL